MKNCLKKGDALLIVDSQIDFFPGGALPVADGDKIIPIINEWIAAAQENNIPIFASRDWHPANHCSFKDYGGHWPTHCIQNSTGANIHPDINLPKETIIIDKADDPKKEAYSAFEGKTKQGILLIQVMKEQKIRRLWINGLALDYCVCESALDARNNGLEVHLILKGTKPTSEKTGAKALQRMRRAGVMVELD